MALPAKVGHLPQGPLGRWAARLRARVRAAELDAELADGADPWGSAPLLLRAQRIGSLEERRAIAAGLRALVELAERRRPASPYLVIRSAAVLDDREALLALADRLDHPAPVDVAIVARLRRLVADPASPVYADGGDAEELAEVTARCLLALSAR